MAQQVGAFGYAIQFPISGFPSLTDRTWEVIITRPDGTSVARLSSDDDVSVSDITETPVLKGTMAVRIKQGDFSIPGSYRLQAFDKTDPENASLRSSVRVFDVVGSLSEPTS